MSAEKGRWREISVLWRWGLCRFRGELRYLELVVAFWDNPFLPHAVTELTPHENKLKIPGAISLELMFCDKEY